MSTQVPTFTTLVVPFVVLTVFGTDCAVRRIGSGVAGAPTNLAGKQLDLFS